MGTNLATPTEPGAAVQPFDPPPGGGMPPPPGGYPPPPGTSPNPAGWATPSGLPPLPPPTSPPRTRTGLWVALGVVALACFALIGTGVFFLAQSDVSNAQVGDCIDLEFPQGAPLGELATDVTANKVDCDSEDAAHRVAVRNADPQAECPTEAYTFYFQEGGPFGNVRLCLVPNVAEGDCFVEANSGAEVFDCAQGERPDALRILRVVEGESDESRCDGLEAEDVFVLTFPEPPTTLCFEPFGPSTFPLGDAGT